MIDHPEGKKARRGINFSTSSKNPLHRAGMFVLPWYSGEGYAPSGAYRVDSNSPRIPGAPLSSLHLLAGAFPLRLLHPAR